ncbi:MAG: hypothetical protein HYY25_08795 [Candidatus Wallbacteria bacterium]|nr:hypothetical protein [Candidatus Wallbacteria bacterium]
MLALLILLIFAAGGALVFTRVLPILLALPLMAVAIAVLAVPSWAMLAAMPPLEALAALGRAVQEISRDVVGAGALMLHSAYATIVVGAMVAVFLKEAGVTDQIVRLAAELSGDNPFGVSLMMLLVVAALFTTLGGLGSIVMIGTIVLPVLQAVGVPPILAASIFLFGISLGGILNPINWSIYKEVLGLDLDTVRVFAAPLAVLGLVVAVAFLALELRRSPATRDTRLLEGFLDVPRLLFLALVCLPRAAGSASGLPALAYLTAVLPIVLVTLAGFEPLPAFLAALAFGHAALGRRRSVRLLTQSVIDGVSAVAPAVALMMGLGMLLKALWHPGVKSALAPLLLAVTPSTAAGYFITFALAAPLALYRGPLNVWGLGFGLTGILGSAQTMPPAAIMAALLSVGQIQGISDPTNTHNVWVAGFTGVTTRDILVRTLPYAWLLALSGLALACAMYY